MPGEDVAVPRDEEMSPEATGKAGLADLAKKAIFASIGAAFMTEEAIRKYVADASLPRDIAGYVTQNASRAKEELFTFLGREISRAIAEGDLWREAQRFLTTHRVKITLDFEPKEGFSAEVEGETKEAREA
jgi:hypothetical protein